MPRQNRVTPFGEIEAVAARGLLTGNRGILHDTEAKLGRARWRHAHWIVCLLAFKDIHRQVMSPGSWTELFFLDEAVALAAGHRPCAYCRREDFRRFAEAWRAARGLAQPPRAPEIDRLLHKARIDARTRRRATFAAEPRQLPEGCFFADDDGGAWLVHQRRALRWTHQGYDGTRPLGGRLRPVLTPSPTVAVLRAGYAPMLHPSAGLALAARLG